MARKSGEACTQIDLRRAADYGRAADAGARGLEFTVYHAVPLIAVARQSGGQAGSVCPHRVYRLHESAHKLTSFIWNGSGINQFWGRCIVSCLEI